MRKRVSIPIISGKLNKVEQKASAQMPANAPNLTRAVQNTTTLTITLPILFACLRNEIQPIRARACYTCVREKAINKNKASKEAYAKIGRASWREREKRRVREGIGKQKQDEQQ